MRKTSLNLKMPTEDIFRLVDQYRSGFDIRIENRKKIITRKEENQRESSMAAALLLDAFEPLIQEYYNHLRHGIVTVNTKNLSYHFKNTEYLKLTMEAFEDEDILGELRCCFLQFCLKYDGIVQNFHWEVSNWILSATKDILTHRPPLSKFTSLHDPEDIEFSSWCQDDTEFDKVEDKISIDEWMSQLRNYTPSTGWNNIFSETECDLIRAILNYQGENLTETNQQVNKLVQSIHNKVMAIQCSLITIHSIYQHTSLF